jgi:F-box-like
MEENDISSILASFPESSLASFRQRLALYWASVVIRSAQGHSTNPCVIQYNTVNWRPALEAIPWGDLFQAHNDACQHRSIPITALSTTLQCLQDPAVFPTIGWSVLFEIVLERLLLFPYRAIDRRRKDSNATRRIEPPSLALVVESMAAMIRLVPSLKRHLALHSLPRLLRILPDLNSCWSQYHVLLTVVESLTMAHDHIFLPPFFELWSGLDWMVEPHPDATSSGTKAHTRRRLGAAVIDVWHGDVDHQTLPLGYRPRATADPTPDLQQVLRPRRRIFHYEPAEPDRRLRGWHGRFWRIAKGLIQRPTVTLLRSLVQRLPARAWASPAVLYFVVHLATTRPSVGGSLLPPLLELFWHRIQLLPDGEDLMLLLRVYAEIVSEYSCFDAVHVCQQAVQPVVDYLLQRPLMTGDEPAADERSRHSRRPYLWCLSWIISKRKAVYPALQASIIQLSLQCDDPASDWIPPGPQGPSILSFLQCAGLLGLCEDVETESTDAGSIGFSHQGLRQAAAAFSSVVSSDGLFSSTSSYNSDLAIGSTTVVLPPPAPVDVSFPGDVLEAIFLFLGFQEVSQTIRLVCKEWRDLADRAGIWYTFYRGHFGIYESDPRKKQVAKCWKQLFVNRHLDEQSIGFRYTASGWRVRLCGYVGCSHLMRTAAMKRKHYQSHRTGGGPQMKAKRLRISTEK